jgi:hypothetical protein
VLSADCGNLLRGFDAIGVIWRQSGDYTEDVIPQTLIETPFPTTAEVTVMLGVSRERVRNIERMLFGGSVALPLKPRKNGRGNGAGTAIERAKAPRPRRQG